MGVPFVIKQLMADCAGKVTTVGSKFFATQPVAAADSAAVARLRKAGGNILEEGQTTCCYAKSEKSWIDDPAGISWETFHTTGESTDYGTSVQRGAQIAQRLIEQSLRFRRRVETIENIAGDDDRVHRTRPRDLDQLRQRGAMLGLARPPVKGGAKMPIGGM
mgnify:CR=1 FL=1